jgi:hypothetical protein
LATLIDVPMYADIFGMIPIAEALLYKGAQLGTILSFVMAITNAVTAIHNHAPQGGEAEAAGIVHLPAPSKDRRF